MKSRHLAVAVLVATSLLTSAAFADCAGDGVADKKRSFQKAQTFEHDGKKEQALFAYQAAQGYACEPNNPYEMDAARRAAPLGLELGQAAEKKGDLARAFQLYEAGGHFAHADRVFIETIRAEDAPQAYQRALEHYRNREGGAFVSNHAAALKVTGSYEVDPKYMAEVMAMPKRGVERAAEKEKAAFNEQFLREYVQLIQSQPDDPSDFAALQRAGDAQTAFANKWPDQDPMKTSRDAIQAMRMWGLNGNDEALSKAVDGRVKSLVEQRATLLRDKFFNAPKLLGDAMDFYRVLGSDAGVGGKIKAIRSQARQLAAQADAKQRYGLAAEYYNIAGDDAAADASRQKQQQLAMQKMQPSIDAAQKQAEELQKQFSDPKAVEAMRKQAEAAQAAIQAQQKKQQKNGDKKKSAEELEKELGM
ncbi:hypothetical protein [Peristeroidobacter soli]|uniref:hypothetical protein n=1 Tax=Peristeroidobacter soli TaxID=2497877 RepID=UPI00101D268E|nr:hypothetical protein [Peristeroidobacter soli]